jgi:thiol-disulfide isomerase/thioredoxin
MFFRRNKKTALLLVILLIVIGVYYLESQKVAPEIKVSQQATEFKDGKYPKAPELQGISGYLNTKAGLTIGELKGKVVLIDFWTYTCINCIRTLPHLRDWHDKYSDKGLVIIGVHTPEFEFEKDKNNVQDAIEKYELKYPVVQDNDYATWQAFRNQYWPRKYLIDTDGFIRYDHIGEGAYAETENKIQELLLEAGMNPESAPRIEVPDFSNLKQLARTPELYAGYKFALGRGQNVNSPGLQPNQVADYSLPTQIPSNAIQLKGKWKSNADDLTSIGSGEIVLNFLASSVNIVTGPIPQTQKIQVLINDKPIKKEQAGSDVSFEGDKAFITINNPQLYNVVNGNHGKYKLTLVVEEGFNFNAFTFG